MNGLLTAKSLGTNVNREEIMLDKKEYRVRLRDWVREMKALMGCKVCGLSDPLKLEFHHRNPAEKMYKIADMVSKGMPLPEILAEIRKCDILCVEHHEEADRVLLEKWEYKLPRHPHKHPDQRGGRNRKKK